MVLNSCSDTQEELSQENLNSSFEKSSSLYTMSAHGYEISHIEGDQYLTKLNGDEGIVGEHIYTNLSYSTEILVEQDNTESLIIKNESGIDDSVKISNLRQLENGTYLYDFEIYNGLDETTTVVSDINSNFNIFTYQNDIQTLSAPPVPWGPIGVVVSIATWLLSDSDESLSDAQNCRIAAVEGCGAGNVQSYGMVVDEGWFTTDSHCEFDCK